MRVDGRSASIWGEVLGNLILLDGSIILQCISSIWAKLGSTIWGQVGPRKMGSRAVDAVGTPRRWCGTSMWGSAKPVAGFGGRHWELSVEPKECQSTTCHSKLEIIVPKQSVIHYQHCQEGCQLVGGIGRRHGPPRAPNCFYWKQ
jgi:hypothetical protein